MWTQPVIPQPSPAAWRPASRRTGPLQGTLFHPGFASTRRHAPTAQGLLRTGPGQMSFQRCASWRTAEIEPDTVADDLRRKAVPFVERSGGWCHHAVCLPLARFVVGGSITQRVCQVSSGCIGGFVNLTMPVGPQVVQSRPAVAVRRAHLE